MTVLSTSRESVGEVELPAPLFAAPVRRHLLYEAVRMQLANRRGGTAKTKTRGEVSGGGAKPWRQKGTGRARAGSSRSPIWVGGATVHGPRPRDYSYRLPASARREALCSALSARQREGRLVVVDRFETPGGKTKEFVKALETLGAPKALVVFLFAFFSVLYNTVEGARSLKPEMLEVARSFRSGEWGVWRDLLIPYTLPFAMTGVRQGIGRGLVGLIAGEFFLSGTGIGLLIMQSERDFNVPGLYGSILVVTILGVLLMAVGRGLENRFAAWRGLNR